MLDSDEWSRVPTIERKTWVSSRVFGRHQNTFSDWHPQLTLDWFIGFIPIDFRLLLSNRSGEKRTCPLFFFMLAPKAQTQPNKLAME